MNRNQELSDLAASLREIAARLEALVEGEGAESSQSSQSTPSTQSTPSSQSAPTLTFPLNDRYRFMRELFGNSAARFNEVIAALAAVASEAEAVGVLEAEGVALDTETGKEFIAAVAAQIAK